MKRRAEKENLAPRKSYTKPSCLEVPLFLVFSLLFFCFILFFQACAAFIQPFTTPFELEEIRGVCHHLFKTCRQHYRPFARQILQEVLFFIRTYRNIIVVTNSNLEKQRLLSQDVSTNLCSKFHALLIKLLSGNSTTCYDFSMVKCQE